VFGSGSRQAKTVPKEGKNKEILCLSLSRTDWNRICIIFCFQVDIPGRVLELINNRTFIIARNEDSAWAFGFYRWAVLLFLPLDPVSGMGKGRY
jgi:hypothetical protein